MSIQFACPVCGEPYDLPDEARGRKAKCACGAMLIVPTEVGAAVTIVPPEDATGVGADPGGGAENAEPAAPSDPPPLPRDFAKPSAPSTTQRREPSTRGAPPRSRKRRDATAILRFATALQWVGYLFVVSYLGAALFGLVAGAIAIANDAVIASLPPLGGALASLFGAWISWIAFPAMAALLRTFLAIEENTRPS